MKDKELILTAASAQIELAQDLAMTQLSGNHPIALQFNALLRDIEYELDVPPSAAGPAIPDPFEEVERKEFEDWIKHTFWWPELERNAVGGYSYYVTDIAWEAWLTKAKAKHHEGK